MKKRKIFYGFQTRKFVTTDYRTLKAIMQKPLPLTQKKLIIVLLLSAVVIKFKKKSISRDTLSESV